MTLPNGDPLWARTAAASTYGGVPTKKNYLDTPPINPETDVNASQYLRLTADVAAVARTASVFKCTLTCTDYLDVANNPLVNNAIASFYGQPVTYPGAAPPNYYPRITTVALGDYRISFSTSANTPDDFGVTANLYPVHGIASASRTGNAPVALLTQISATDWTLRIVSSSDGTTHYGDATVYLDFS